MLLPSSLWQAALEQSRLAQASAAEQLLSETTARLKAEHEEAARLAATEQESLHKVVLTVVLWLWESEGRGGHVCVK